MAVEPFQAQVQGAVNRFTGQVRNALHVAHGFAGDFIATEHLLMALATSPGVAGVVLEQAGLSLDRIQAVVPPGSGGPSGTIPFSPAAKRVLELALDEALDTTTRRSALPTSSSPCSATRAKTEQLGPWEKLGSTPLPCGAMSATRLRPVHPTRRSAVSSAPRDCWTTRRAAGAGRGDSSGSWARVPA